MNSVKYELGRRYRDPAHTYDTLDVYNVSGRASFCMSVSGLFSHYGDYMVKYCDFTDSFLEPYIEIVKDGEF